MKISKIVGAGGTLLWLSVAAHGQQSITAAGGDASGAGGSSSYSIGQVAFTTQDNSSYQIAAGVQHPIEVSLIDAVTTHHPEIEASVFPNPATTSVTLSTTGVQSGMGYTLYDLQGRQLLSGAISEPQTSLSLTALPPATYLLLLRQTDGTQKTFRIIKR